MSINYADSSLNSGNAPHMLAGADASKLLLALGFYSAPYDPFKIAEALEIAVDNSVNYDNIDNAGYITHKNGATSIWINPFDSDARQRFTLAHELGHYIHDILPNIGKDSRIEDTPDTLYRSGESDIREFRANEFAGQLLMPRDDIFFYARKLVDNAPEKSIGQREFIDKMAKIFEVSKPAIMVRLKKLNLLAQDYRL